MSHSIDDQNERAHALDITQSLIVQAPAGSGKTELLSQRYLKLLPSVNNPEEIIAITFTRKAAAEMQHRIMQTLRDAQQGEAPSSPHKHVSIELAQEALKHDRAKQWELLSTPNRLRILTLDALAAQINQQQPLSSQLGIGTKISNTPRMLYEQAVQNTLQQQENAQLHAMSNELLVAFGNKYERVVDLLCELLAKREQWLGLVASAHTNEEAYIAQCEQAIDAYRQQIIDAIGKNCEEATCQDIFAILSYTASNMTDTPAYDDKQHHIDTSQPLKKQADFWLQACELLLTKSGQWRKTVNKRQGFLPKTSLNSSEQASQDALKQSLFGIIASWQESAELLEQLQAIQILPTQTYDPSHWACLQALSTVLIYAAAELNLAFQTNNRCDFNELTLGALRALGDCHRPSELALLLDYSIQHILIDEYQDTSDVQNQLISALTRGWERGDARTLFFVGDPMQSIYRFRNANVGHFIHALDNGFNNIPMHPITLKRNFRSCQRIVEWVNEVFTQIFPTHNNPSLGAVTYSPSVSTQFFTGEHQALSIIAAPDRIQESVCLAQQISDCQRDCAAGDSIAILVRSRSQLKSIIPTLHAHGIAIQGIDIFPLIQKEHIQDTLTLIRCFSHLEDSVAWTALLRTPWFGLPLKDIFILLEKNRGAVWQSIKSNVKDNGISQETQHRLNHLIPVIDSICRLAGRQPLATWARFAWRALGGAHTLSSTESMKEMDMLFDHLAAYQNDMEVDQLLQHCQSLYAETTHKAQSVQIMTIHKSKGLEFDHVFIPGCQQIASNQQHAAFMWDCFTHDNTPHAALGLRLSNVNDNITSTITARERQKQHQETMRLFYVAVTRAKKSLTFSHYQSSTAEEIEPSINTKKGTFLDFICQQATSLAALNTVTHTNSDIIPEESILTTSRLSLNALQSITCHTTQATSNTNQSKQPDHKNQQIGMLMHAWLERFTMGAADGDNCNAWCREYCQIMGYDEQAAQQVNQQFDRLCSDKRLNNWLNSTHTWQKSEYALIGQDNSMIVIDYCFIDQSNRLWIIDFKTSDHIPESTDKALQRHQSQLTQYAAGLSTCAPPHHEIMVAVVYTSGPETFFWRYQSGQMLSSEPARTETVQ